MSDIIAEIGRHLRKLGLIIEKKNVLSRLINMKHDPRLKTLKIGSFSHYVTVSIITWSAMHMVHVKSEIASSSASIFNNLVDAGLLAMTAFVLNHIVSKGELRKAEMQTRKTEYQQAEYQRISIPVTESHFVI